MNSKLLSSRNGTILEESTDKGSMSEFLYDLGKQDMTKKEKIYNAQMESCVSA